VTASLFVETSVPPACARRSSASELARGAVPCTEHRSL